MELEPVLVEELLQLRRELVTEDATENGYGEQETWRSSDPSGAIHC
jgi:hypothetical protein